VPVYPNASAGLENPVSNGSVLLSVHSRYAAGWADYFRTRTSANVTWTGPDTVTMNLSTAGQQGAVSLASRTVAVRGIAGGHSLQNLNATIYAKPKHPQKFTGGLGVTLDVSSANRDLSIEVGPGAIGNGNGGGGTVTCSDSLPQTEPARIVYTNATGLTQTWEGNYTVTCPTGKIQLNLDATANRPFQYTDTGSGNFAGTVKFYQHPADGNTTFHPGAWNNSRFLVRHYVALARGDGSVTVEAHQHGNGGANLYLTYAASDSVVEYIHATRNNVSVSLG